MDPHGGFARMDVRNIRRAAHCSGAVTGGEANARCVRGEDGGMRCRNEGDSKDDARFVNKLNNDKAHMSHMERTESEPHVRNTERVHCRSTVTVPAGASTVV